MKNLKYTIIKSQKQYDEYCSVLEDLVFSKKKIYTDEIELLNLLIRDYNDQVMANYQFEFTPVELLKDLLSENNITQIELSKRIKVSPQLVSDVLNFRREITKKLAYKLSEEFCLNYSAFLKPYELQKAS